eukprot:8412443-Pyramimonas_sp.AAC.1
MAEEGPIEPLPIEWQRACAYQPVGSSSDMPTPISLSSDPRYVHVSWGPSSSSSSGSAAAHGPQYDIDGWAPDQVAAGDLHSWAPDIFAAGHAQEGPLAPEDGRGPDGPLAPEDGRGPDAPVSEAQRPKMNRKGSGVKRCRPGHPDGPRWGTRGGTKNENVRWHTAKARAEKQGRLSEFLLNNPKPKNSKGLQS